MGDSRRAFLQAAGASLGALALSGLSSTTAAADPADAWRPADSSNYTSANRSASDVRWLVLHTIEGSYEGAISWFQNPDSNVSSHYVVGNQPDQITKMVRLEDEAWTQGNSQYNDTGVSIEMEGHANQTDFNDNIYQQAAEIARYVCDTYGIPKRHPADDIAPCSADDGQGGIIGHNQIPSPYDCSQVTGGKVDPGDTWDWNYFMSLVVDDGGGGGGGGGGGRFEDGDLVHNTTELNTRHRPNLGSWVVETLPADSTAEVVNGPVESDGYTWWGLHWQDANVWGWSVDAYLDPGPGAAFADGDIVHNTAWLNTRYRPNTGSAVVDTLAPDSRAEVVNGPVESDGYTWWGLHWLDAGVWGWSVEAYLDAGP